MTKSKKDDYDAMSQPEANVPGPDATAAEANTIGAEAKTEVGTDDATGEAVHTDVAPIDADAKPTPDVAPQTDDMGAIAHPTLSEAQAMFRENAGLDSVLITTDHGEARAYRDCRVEVIQKDA